VPIKQDTIWRRSFLLPASLRAVSVTAWTAMDDYLLTELKLNVSKTSQSTEKAAKSGNYAYKVQIL